MHIERRGARHSRPMHVCGINAARRPVATSGKSWISGAD
jgi:hypothetical protein